MTKYQKMIVLCFHVSCYALYKKSHDMDTIGIDLGKYRSLKVRTPVGTWETRKNHDFPK